MKGPRMIIATTTERGTDEDTENGSRVTRSIIDNFMRRPSLEDRAVTTIYTFAGTLEAYEGSFAPEEVDHVFTVPVDWLLSHEPEVYGTVLTTIPDEDFPFDRIPGGRQYPWRKRRTEVWFYQYGDETIWGLTARILHTFLKRLPEIEKSLK